MNILEEINDYKLEFVKRKAKDRPIEELKSSLKIDDAKNFSFSNKLFKNQDHTSFIGEIKRASPSAGRIIEDEVDILDIVKKYEINSVSCLSILTDEKYFNGSNEDLINIKKHTCLPILRKEFIVDEYQIYESKYIGADCILIIMALLDFDTAIKFENLIRRAEERQSRIRRRRRGWRRRGHERKHTTSNRNWGKIHFTSRDAPRKFLDFTSREENSGILQTKKSMKKEKK